MKSAALAVLLAVTGCAQLRGEGELHVSYVIAGGKAHPGGKAPATGGAALMPAGRILLAMPGADPYVTAAPAIVSPTSLDALSFVGAVDAGASWHASTRAWHLGTGATLAPSYMRFCNGAWCLKEWTWLYGGEAHFGGRVLRTEGEGGLTADITLRVLTGRPTAWYWPKLAAPDADVAHWIGSIGGAATWRF